MTDYPRMSLAGGPDSPILGWGTPDDETALLPLNATSPRLEASRLIKSGPGVLYGLTVTNTKASTQYIQLFDAPSVPADTAVPILAQSVAANSTAGFNWIPGRTFLSGIVVCNSSTQGTKTIGSADCIFDAQFV